MSVTIKQAENFSPCVKMTYRKTGSPVNLTGCTAYSQMRREPNSELIATGSCVIDAVNGRITVTYDSTVTANIPLGEYGYDIWLVPNGDESEKRPIWTERVKVIGRYTDNFGE